MGTINSKVSVPSPGDRIPLKRMSVEPSAAHLLATLRADPPGYPLEDPYNQTRQYTGIIYLAIKAISRALQSSTVQLMKERKKPLHRPDDSIKKALPSVQAHASDERWVPVHNHPICKILERPNPRDTWSKFQSRVVIQYHLTGRALIWGVPNNAGKPAELWVLPTAMCWPGPRDVQFPEGSWRITQYYPNGQLGYVGGPGGGSMAGAIIDARQVYDFREPHALYDWAPYSHLAGTKDQVDLVQKIDRGCWSAMDQSFDPDGFLTIPGATEDQLEAVQARLRQKHQGPEHRGGIVAIGGTIDGKAASFSPWTSTPKDMEYGQGWQRYVEFILAAFGLHKATVGLGDASSYSELFAAIKQTAMLCYGPFVNDLSQVLTNGLVRDWGVPYRVQIDLPKIEDIETQDRQISADVQASAITVNEIRALRGRKPLDGGDVIPEVFKQIQAQKAQPPAPPGGAPGGMPPGGMPPGGMPPGMPGGPPGGDQPPAPGGQPPPDDQQAGAPPGGPDAGAVPEPGADQQQGQPEQPDAEPAPDNPFAELAGQQAEGDEQAPEQADDSSSPDESIEDATGNQALSMLGVPQGDDSAIPLLLASIKARIKGDKDTAHALDSLADHPDELQKMLDELKGDDAAHDAGDDTIKKAIDLPSSSWASKYGLVFDTNSRRWKKPNRDGSTPANHKPNPERVANAQQIATSVHRSHVDPHSLTLEHVKHMRQHLDSLRVVELKAMLKHIEQRVGGRRVDLSDRLLSHVTAVSRGDEPPAGPRRGEPALAAQKVAGPTPPRQPKGPGATFEPAKTDRGESNAEAEAPKPQPEPAKASPEPEKPAPQPAPQESSPAKQPLSDEARGHYHKQLASHPDLKRLGLTKETLGRMPDDAVSQLAAGVGIKREDVAAVHAHVKENAPLPEEAVAKATEPIAERAADPAEKSKLQRVHEWADSQAAKHADRVAKHFGITPQRAHQVLSHAIRSIARRAVNAPTGKVDAELTHRGSGKKLNLSVTDKERQQQSANKPSPKPKLKPFGFDSEFDAAMAKPKSNRTTPPGQSPGVKKPANPAGKGSLPTKQKAFTDPDAFLKAHYEHEPRDSHGRWTTDLIHHDPAPYGYCPECRTPNIATERRKGGDSHCGNGHAHPAAAAKYASTQIELTGDIAARLRSLGDLIDPDDLCEDEGGVESAPHITVRYGLHDMTPKRVESVLCCPS